MNSDIIGIVITDANNKITAANNEFLRMIDYTREELEADQISWNRIVPAEHRKYDAETKRLLAETGNALPGNGVYSQR
ncbi:MAG: PAS domain-containing protein [Planctomycetaceae bacterium]